LFFVYPNGNESRDDTGAQTNVVGAIVPHSLYVSQQIGN